ncbi:putative membrane protein [Synechococcus sp. BOUM118]|nr:putative membrane protein [Synechococcus sp. BOUM118]
MEINTYMILKALKSFSLYYILTILSISSFIILARNVSPIYLNNWYIWFTLVSLLTVIGALRLETAIILEKDEFYSFQILLCCFLISIIISVLLFFTLYSLKLLIFPLLNLSHAFIACFCGLMGSHIHSVGHYNLRNQRINIYNIQLLGLPILTSGFQLIFFIKFSHHENLALYASFLSYISAYLLSAFYFFATIDSLGSKITFSISPALVKIKEYKVYPSYMSLFTLSIFGRDKIIYAILATIAEKSAASYISMSQKLLNISNTAISTPIRPIFFAKAIRQSSDYDFGKAISPLIFSLNYIATPLWLLAFCFSEQIVTIVFGPQWIAVSIYFRILAPAYFIISITGWLDKLYDIKSRQKLLFKIENAFSIIMISSLCLIRAYTSSLTFISMVMGLVTFFYGWVWVYVTYQMANLNNSGFYKLFWAQFSMAVIFFLLPMLGSVVNVHIDILRFIFSCIYISLGVRGMLQYLRTFS